MVTHENAYMLLAIKVHGLLAQKAQYYKYSAAADEGHQGFDNHVLYSSQAHELLGKDIKRDKGSIAAQAGKRGKCVSTNE
mmetsp:Transcript_139010/g.245642  ORF Transcript_139010/g.245642 Transcript_139010/m.245642 type:complete len:80 (-) Transcript_139010:104-343(-)